MLNDFPSYKKTHNVETFVSTSKILYKENKFTECTIIISHCDVSIYADNSYFISKKTVSPSFEFYSE